MLSFINLTTRLRISLSSLSILSNQKRFCSLSEAEYFGLTLTRCGFFSYGNYKELRYLSNEWLTVRKP